MLPRSSSLGSEGLWAGYCYDTRVEGVGDSDVSCFEQPTLLPLWAASPVSADDCRLEHPHHSQGRLQKEMYQHLQWIILSKDKMLRGLTRSL